MAKLHIIAGQNSGCKFDLSKTTTSIGRLDKNNISVDQDKISREHAEINYHDQGYYLRDLDSFNGTYINNTRIANEVLCKPGDNIRIGGVTFRFFPDIDKASEIKIPGYDIEELIGQGGMGSVFRAVQISMDRHVALKVLRSDLSGKKKFVTRFLHEARAAGKLNHPNLIHVNDAGQVGNTYYFSMELVSGNDLSQIMAYRDFDHVELFRIAAKVADALDCAHRRGIIHRDIKPENIILTEDGEVKLADLGIAKIFDVEGSTPSEDKAKSVLGTPHYMSPEQASGKDVDGRTDLYSLGATIYHVLSSQPPFEDTSNQAVMRKHISEDPEPLENLCPRLPKEALDIVNRLMKKNPEERFSSAAEARDALEKASKVNRRPTPALSLRVPIIPTLDLDEPELDDDLGWGTGTGEVSALWQGLFVAGIVVISLIASFVFAEKPPPQMEAAQKLLDLGWAMETEGKFAAAEAKYTEVLTDFSNDDISYTLANDYQQLLNARRKNIQQAKLEGDRREAKAKWTAFDNWRRNNRTNLDEWQQRLGLLKKYFAATKFEDMQKLVKDSEDKLLRTRMEVLIKNQNDTYYTAQRAANDVGSTYKFDEATALLKDYRTAYPDSVRKDDVKYLLEKVSSAREKALAAEETTFARICENAKKQLAAANFSAVIPNYENFIKSAKFEEYRAKAQAAIEATNQAIDLAIDEHMAKSEVAVLAALRRMETERAETLLVQESAVLAGTKYEATLKKRLNSIRIIKKFHEDMIEKIAAERGRETNLTVAQYFSGLEKLRIIGATPKGLVTTPEAGITITLYWEKISPAEMVAIYKLYADPRDADQVRAIHIYSMIFGVGKKAEKAGTAEPPEDSPANER